MEAQAKETRSPSVCLAALYFGALPSWLPVWLRSCAGNPSIDWLLLTDTAKENLGRLPPNVTVHTLPFEQVKALARDRLGTEVRLDAPYKLCDFKPAYGVMLSDYLDGYDVWGHVDLDVVWGDLRRFFPDDLLRSHDRVQHNGHLVMYRNTPEANRLYETAAPGPSYREVFASPRIWAFDEWGGMHGLSYAAGARQAWNRQLVDADPLSFRLRDPRVADCRRQLFFWEDGRLFREFIPPGRQTGSYEYPAIERDEFAYIHLQKRRMAAPDFDIWAVRGFYITPDGFVSKQKHVHSRSDFSRLNPESLTYRLVPRVRRELGRLRLRLTDAIR